MMMRHIVDHARQYNRLEHALSMKQHRPHFGPVLCGDTPGFQSSAPPECSPAVLVQTALFYICPVKDGNIRLSYAARLSVNSRLTAWAQGRAQRKPLLLFSLFGLFLLRFEARRLFVVLFHEPPRNTRAPRCPHISGINPVYAFFIHPPRSLPISVVCCAIYSYCSGVVYFNSTAKRM